MKVTGFGIFFVALAVPGLALAGTSDPIFTTLPFESWFQKTSQTHFKWSEHVAPAVLSVHQRLVTQVEVSIDGAELARRSGKGQLLIMCQFTDASGGIWQDHGSIDLEKVEQGIRSSDITFTESAFVLPGEYSVALAIFDTATDEHAVRRDKFHVAPLIDDPLPHAWEGLPRIEFMPPAETPDAWFLPSVTGRLHLPLAGARPSQIDLVVNLTPSDRASGSLRVRDRNLGALIPALKVVSQIDAPGVPLQFSLLDLTRRRMTFRQESGSPGADWPNWSKMRDALSESTPASIDVKALEDRQHNAAFFVGEVGRLLAPSRALIILSSPVEFEAGQDLQPIRASLPRNCQVFYIRYQPAVHTAPVLTMGRQPALGRRGGLGSSYPGLRPVLTPPIVDQLAATLKPLAPRLFDVRTPMEFRRALAAILAELADR